MKTSAAFLCTLLLSGQNVLAKSDVAESESAKTLLKNWALSRCIAQSFPESSVRADANATASAYLEQGTASIETYEAIDKLTGKFVGRVYGGSIKAKFSTMKCIDLFNSDELDQLAEAASRLKSSP